MTLWRNVTIRAESFKIDRHVSLPSLRRAIMTRLLEDLASEKVCKVHGYYLGVTNLFKIGRGSAVGDSGDVSFRVVFECRMFRPFEGEVLNGVVYRVCSNGVFLRCGPMKSIYVSWMKMPGYKQEGQRFVSGERAAIENGVVVRFAVLGVRWSNGVRGGREFQMLGNLDGESLGPVSFPASGELDL